MENTYKEGEVVFERIRPNQKLIVRRIIKNMYYCQDPENLNRKDLVYVARELTSRTGMFDSANANKRSSAAVVELNHQSS